MEEQTNSGNRKWLIILGLLLIIAIVVLLFTYLRMNGLVKEKEENRGALQHELDSLVAEHNKVKEIYGTLSDSLSTKDSVIQAQATQIRKLLDTEWEYYKIKKRITALQQIAQRYVSQIDSLYNVNRELKEENVRIQEEYRIEKNRSTALVKDKEALTEKVTMAAVLKAYNVKAVGLRYRSGGTKEQETDKAGRVERIKVCLTLGENSLVPAGRKSIFIRIMRPDKVVVIKSKYDTFRFNGEDIPYSIEEEVDYKGKSLDVCGFWIKKDKTEPAMVGTYNVTVYCDGVLIGSTTFELR
ncbi:MAG: hypothetical protein FJY10_00045 [Bacteroidetes bacterium]|nr:hypothetical protein [Bacteroidota bacterium]